MAKQRKVATVAGPSVITARSQTTGRLHHALFHPLSSSTRTAIAVVRSCLAPSVAAFTSHEAAVAGSLFSFSLNALTLFHWAVAGPPPRQRHRMPVPCI